MLRDGGCGVVGRGVTRVGLQARLPGEVVVLTESSRSEKEPVLLKDEPGLRHAALGPGCHRVVWEDSQSPREAQGVCVQGMLGLSGVRAEWGEAGWRCGDKRDPRWSQILPPSI